MARSYGSAISPVRADAGMDSGVTRGASDAADAADVPSGAAAGPVEAPAQPAARRAPMITYMHSVSEPMIPPPVSGRPAAVERTDRAPPCPRRSGRGRPGPRRRPRGAMIPRPPGRAKVSGGRRRSHLSSRVRKHAGMSGARAMIARRPNVPATSRSRLERHFPRGGSHAPCRPGACRTLEPCHNGGATWAPAGPRTASVHAADARAGACRHGPRRRPPTGRPSQETRACRRPRSPAAPSAHGSEPP